MEPSEREDWKVCGASPRDSCCDEGVGAVPMEPSGGEDRKACGASPRDSCCDEGVGAVPMEPSGGEDWKACGASPRDSCCDEGVGAVPMEPSEARLREGCCDLGAGAVHVGGAPHVIVWGWSAPGCVGGLPPHRTVPLCTVVGGACWVLLGEAVNLYPSEVVTLMF